MSVPKYPLLKNVHSYLKHPSNEDVYLTKYNYYYHHYICDGFNDVGWGCGYRTLQSICSMIIMTNEIEVSVPSIKQIQEILCKIGDKETSFMNSREWTGAIETCYVIDELFNIPSYLHHISNSERITTKRNEIVNYFRDHGGVIAMGGDQDAASKLIAGVSVSKDEELSLLVVDPHFTEVPKSPEDLINRGYVKWQREDEFIDLSFYNLCMPKLI